MLRVTAARLSAAHPQAMTELGHLLETFCVGEVDLVLERDDGAIAAIEVKAAERVTASEFRGLTKLRDGLGERFLGGVVLHLGRRGYTHEDRLHALPVDSLWLAGES